jgi:hypothetical protein
MRRIVVSRLALTGGLVGGLVVGVLAGALGSLGRVMDGGASGRTLGGSEIWAELGIAALITTALGGLATWLGSAAPRPEPVARDVGRAVLAAIASAPVWATLVAALHGLASVRTGGIVTIPLVAIAFGILALVVTVPLGVAYGLVHAGALSLLRDELAVPSWRGVVRARGIALGVDLFGALVLVLVARGVPAGADSVIATLAAQSALAVLDLVLVVRDAVCIDRFVSRVRVDPSMRLVPLGMARVSGALAPIDDRPTRAVVSARADAYRDRPWAIALVR